MSLRFHSASRLSKYHLSSSSTSFLQGKGSSSILGTTIRAVGAATVYHYISTTNAHPAPLISFVLLISSVGLLGLGPVGWVGFPLKGVRWGHIGSKALLLAAALLISCHYLLHAGPARVLVCEQAGLVLFPLVLAAWSRRPRPLVVLALILTALALAANTSQSTLLHTPHQGIQHTAGPHHRAGGGHGAPGTYTHKQLHSTRKKHQGDQGGFLGAAAAAFWDDASEEEEGSGGEGHHVRLHPARRQERERERRRRNPVPLPDEDMDEEDLETPREEREAEGLGLKGDRDRTNKRNSRHQAGSHSETPPLEVAHAVPEAIHIKAEMPIAVLASGIMLSIATAGSSSATTGKTHLQKRRALEQPLVLLVGAILTAPLAVWQSVAPAGSHAPAPTHHSICGPHCSALAAVVAMGLCVGVHYAPMVLYLGRLMGGAGTGGGAQLEKGHAGGGSTGKSGASASSSSSSLPFLTLACVLCLLAPFSPGPPMGIFRTLVCSGLLGCAALILSGSNKTHTSSAEMKQRIRRQAYASSPLLWWWSRVNAVLRTAAGHVASAPKQRRLFAFLCINTAFMAVEFLTGFSNNSIGLMSDACHMLFDNASISVGMYAAYVAARPPSSQYPFGQARFEVLSGFANAIFLVFIALLIVLESLERMTSPPDISTHHLMAVSVIGLLVNIVGLAAFHEAHLHGVGTDCPFHDHSGDEGGCCGDDDHGAAAVMALSPLGDLVAMSSAQGEITLVDVDTGDQGLKLQGFAGGKLEWSPDGRELTCRTESSFVVWESSHGRVLRGSPPKVAKSRNTLGLNMQGMQDHNMRAMFLHVLADTLGSVGVIISTFFVQNYGWLWTDPMAAVFISVLIIWSVLPLLQQSAEVLLLRVPSNREVALGGALREISELQGVHSVQKPHFWSLTPSEVVGTLRVKVNPGWHDYQQVLQQSLEIFRAVGVNNICVQVEDFYDSNSTFHDQVLSVEHISEI